MPWPVKNRIQPGDGDPRHGTINGYVNHRCRCDPCKAANMVRQQQERDQRRQQLSPDDPRHGKANTYFNYKCRCRPCKDARADYERARGERAIA